MLGTAGGPGAAEEPGGDRGGGRLRDGESYGFATEQVHAGEQPEPGTGARITPVYLSAGFEFDDFDQASARFVDTQSGYSYTRVGNPTNAAVERKLARLDHGASAVLLASGQAATAIAALAIVQAGDHIVCSSSVYEGTKGLFQSNLTRLGVSVDLVADPSDLGEWERLITPRTRMLFGESIPNPRNDVLDVPAVAEIAHRHGLPLVVDNTIATPFLFRPLDHGADIVTYSTSKLLTGHGASLGGAVVVGRGFDWWADAERFPQFAAPAGGVSGPSWIGAYGSDAVGAYLRDAVAMRFGPTQSPWHAFLLNQGLETLSLRMSRHVESALAVAQWLESRPEVVGVDYAGLSSNAHHGTAERLLPRGAGSVFAFTVDGGIDAARRFYNAVELFSRMTHIGDVRSLILHPATTIHVQQTPEQRRSAGISDGMLRLSIGLEDPADLIRDLERGFAALA
ncbi:O-acetylhomoserine aminocarboxypropyltransferase/cysteine synthase family protein [Mycetocola reblochoni]|uniref:O-acetylhomoserine aminocarboxypropyltransferase/cysteine synthase family protein n=1 Tax=Mycetocola reblochoni TaxID=331618 RepID=UPI001FE3642E|nr:aminotransferase class I/II-fold pyridoxal phosphate-dependent enzyme [Mycetocola reblochoni]